jgi:hypothetical protein
MNRFFKFAAAFFILCIAAPAIFPPWCHKVEVDGLRRKQSAGFSWVWDQPAPSNWSAESTVIDFDRLFLIQSAPLGLAAAAIVAGTAFRSRHPPQRSPLAEPK